MTVVLRVSVLMPYVFLQHRAAHKGTSVETEDNEDESNLDVQTLVDKMMRIKGWLKLANERSEKPVDIEGELWPPSLNTFS